MARRPFFSGNYGSALGSYDTAAKLLAQAGQTQGAAMAGLGADIGGAIEKYQLNKEKRAVLTGEIEAALPQFLNDLTMTGDEDEDKKNMSRIEKFKANDMNMSDLKGFAGELARMEKQKVTESALAKQAADIRETEAKIGYYGRMPSEKTTPVDPVKAAQAEALRGFGRKLNAPRSGKRARGPSGAPGPAGAAGGISSQLPSGVPGLPPLPPDQTQPPLAGVYPPLPQSPGAPPAPSQLPPQTPAVTQAMTTGRPVRRNKFENLSRKEKKLLRLAKKDPIGAAMMDEATGGAITDIRKRTEGYMPSEFGTSREVIGADGNPSGLVMIITGKDSTVVQAAPEKKYKVGHVVKLEDGSSQQYMGNGKFVELVKDEFDTREDARAVAMDFGGKVTYSNATGGFNVEMPTGFTRDMVEVKDPAFDRPVWYHEDSKKFFVKDKDGKTREMGDAVTAIGTDPDGHEIVLLNGGSTPYLRKDGLTPILPKQMRPAERAAFNNAMLAPLQRDARLIDYIRAKEMAEAAGKRGYTGEGVEEEDGKKVYYYEDVEGEIRSKKQDDDLDELQKDMEEIQLDMVKLRTLYPPTAR